MNVVKLLGASIALTNYEEAGHLFEREAKKAATFFDRLRLGASPQFFTLLRQCGIPKLAHAVRTHGPDVSRRLCQVFDARVEDVMAYWSSAADFSNRQRMILGLPRAMGGMGLTRMSPSRQRRTTRQSQQPWVALAVSKARRHFAQWYTAKPSTR